MNEILVDQLTYQQPRYLLAGVNIHTLLKTEKGYEVKLVGRPTSEGFKPQTIIRCGDSIKNELNLEVLMVDPLIALPLVLDFLNNYPADGLALFVWRDGKLGFAWQQERL